MAGENKLSDKKLRSLLGKPRENQIMLSDGKGMSVRVSKTGCVSFVYQFRLFSRGENTTWLTLGKYPDLTLSAARKKRDECRSWLAEGKDPRLQLKITKENTGEVTVKNVIDFWFDNYVRKNRKTWKKSKLSIDKHITSVIGDAPLNTVTNDMWFNLFESISKKTPVSARVVFLDMRQAVRFCNLKRRTDYSVLNEFIAREIGEPAQKKSRYLSDEELTDLWVSANTEINNKYMPPQIARLICISIVFGCRISEALLSTWDEWDLDNWIWTVPADHSKNGEKIVRPVPDGLKQWILGLKEASHGHHSIIGIDSSQPQASNAARRIWRKMGHKEQWTLHDLRRTLATHLCDLGVDHYVIEQLLGHTLPGVMGIYNRSQQIDKKREALNLWVNYLDSLLDEDMLKIIGRDDLEKMPEIERVIRDDECKWLTSLNLSVRDEMEKTGLFPQKIHLSHKFAGYRLSEVQDWIKGTWKPE